ncbi:MAG: flagellar export chaperone FliS [Oscillospiraceae bacterium]|nr:flagellar export chaperone FliS [Oscillospiraceae bacterium]
MNAYAHSTYKKQSVNTMTPIEIIVKVYDECERQLHRAVQFIADKNNAKAHDALDRAGGLINGLRDVLDMEAGGEISTNLDALYGFFFKQIITADTKKDAEIIKQLIPQICELKDAFTQISKMPKENVGGNIRQGAVG